ncbi:MAG: hypothetical protein LBJ23_02160 [Tannerella sp.]|jgi:DNA-binding SARP family transcriptional activator|nr:hypothetical protein [Tannerella sp.]
MKRLLGILAIIQMVCCGDARGQGRPQSGLYFASHEVYQDRRTSLHLSPGRPFRFPHGFALEFEVNFRQGDGYYGYVFRIIGDGNTNIDLVANLAGDTSNIWLVHGEKILLSLQSDELLPAEGGGYGLWTKIRVEPDVRRALVTLSINGRKWEIPVEELRRQTLFDIFFGACRLNDFYNTDVCPMSVKNIRIYTAGDQLYRHWELGRHSAGRVYDEVARAEATVDNPVWLIDKYASWRKLTDLHVDDLRGLTPDSTGERIFFVNDRAVYSLSLETLGIDTFVSRGGAPHQVVSGRNIIYNRYTDEIWSYDFDNAFLSRFSFDTRAWSYRPAAAGESAYSHHNAFISPADSSLVTLFGYGFYTYKDVIHIYDDRENRWEQVRDGMRISPRYLSSAGYVNSRQALVFGGYGSRSGRQELSPGAYYDLHLFDFRDFSFTHLWTLPQQSPPFVPSATLVFDETTNRFYTLIYNNGVYDTSLQLAEISVDRPEIRFVGDPIPSRFRDTETWVYLLANARRSDLIAVVSHNDDVSLYAIAHRPLAKESVLQDDARGGAWRLLAIPAAVTIVALLSFIILRKKKKPRAETPDAPFAAAPFRLSDRLQVSAVYLLGGFQVFGMKGENVTSHFSPTLKQLFVFIFFNSLMKDKGVTSEKIDEVLWHDKIGDSARNNRNVNISKLRVVFELVGDVEITSKSGLWQIVAGQRVYCDYTEVLSLLARAKREMLQTPPPVTFFNNLKKRVRKDLLAAEEVCRLLELLGAGELLPGMQAAWFDKFRAAFAKETVDVLGALLRQTEAYPDSLRYRIAEFLLSVDFLHEDAICTKCALLNRSGKRSEAKVAYDAFVRDYERFTGTEYTVSFRDIILHPPGRRL